MVRNPISIGLVSVLISGCGNATLFLPWNVRIAGDLEVGGDVDGRQDVTAENDVMAGDEFSGGRITIVGGGEFGGAVMADDGLGTDGNLDVLGDVNVGGEIIYLPPVSVCGNGVVESGEQCDGSDFTGQTCLTHGFDGGVLACLNDCTVNFGQCTITLPPPPPPSPALLTATVLPPFVGLTEEGDAPAACRSLSVGNFQTKVEIKIEGGEAPYQFRFRNYYGAIQAGNISGQGKFDLFFDAVTPTTACVSSQIRITDAAGTSRDLFFYLWVR